MKDTRETKDKQFHMRLSNTELEMWKACSSELGYRSLSDMTRDAIDELQKKVRNEEVLAKVAVVERLELIASMNDDDRDY